jgi:hypothetical protein
VKNWPEKSIDWKTQECIVVDGIVAFILKELTLKDEKKTESFLKKLSSENDYGKRLLICIGIDLKNKLVEKHIVKQVFDTINYDECLACKDGKSLLSHYEKAIIATRNFVGAIGDNSKKLKLRFSRVMTASVFSKHFYPNIMGIDDINCNPRLLKNAIDEGRLEQVNMPNVGGDDKRKLVWTVPLEDLLVIKEESEKKGENPANEIVGRLGLSITAVNNEYVYWEYESDFNETLFQPCHLSNCWETESLYLSSKMIDGFGRTRPRKGDNINLQLREKIHHSIDDATKYKYNIKYLGIVNDFSIDIANFVGEAMHRYTL